VVEVHGSLQNLKRMVPVVFEGLRCIPVLNRETRRANLQLVADSIRVTDVAPAEPAWTGRNRKSEPSPEPATAEA
jgi:hypothetical protein